MNFLLLDIKLSKDKIWFLHFENWQSWQEIMSIFWSWKIPRNSLIFDDWILVQNLSSGEAFLDSVIIHKACRSFNLFADQTVLTLLWTKWNISRKTKNIERPGGPQLTRILLNYYLSTVTQFTHGKIFIYDFCVLWLTAQSIYKTQKLY